MLELEEPPGRKLTRASLGGSSSRRALCACELVATGGSGRLGSHFGSSLLDKQPLVKWPLDRARGHSPSLSWKFHGGKRSRELTIGHLLGTTIRVSRREAEAKLLQINFFCVCKMAIWRRRNKTPARKSRRPFGTCGNFRSSWPECVHDEAAARTEATERSKKQWPKVISRRGRSVPESENI